MKYKLLSVSHTVSEVNIGDYIQALAAKQFLPSADGFVERERLRQYDGDECRVIMNGWYIHHPENWPPSPKIHPLFVAFHINSLAREAMLSPESTAYLKRHAPIGCRDRYTVQALQSAGVEAYFSGCLTLTLGRTYATAEKDGKCYVVDPAFRHPWKSLRTAGNVLYYLAHRKEVETIARKFPSGDRWLKKRIKLVTFYREYQKLLTKETLLNAEYVCQQDRRYIDDFPTDEARLAEAERLVKGYAKAALVVTSRIHCALPCLGLQTPVVYTEDAAQEEASSCRMDGLKELFTTARWKDARLETPAGMQRPYDASHRPANKPGWKDLAGRLAQTCLNFGKQPAR